MATRNGGKNEPVQPLIILVDDDPDKRCLLERFFGRNFPAHQVYSVSDCASAVPLIQAPVPKIVVTNGRIAQKDGIEFAAYIAHQVHTPVVIISLRSELKQKALDAGASAFVETGEDAEIRDAIQSALDEASEVRNPAPDEPDSVHQNG